MTDLFLLLLMVVVFGYWIHGVITYDWNNFEEDSKADDFLKPYD